MIKKTVKSTDNSKKFRKLYMLIGEFVLLVTVMVGIASAAKLILQSGFLQNLGSQLGLLGTTGKWVGETSNIECINGKTGWDQFYIDTFCYVRAGIRPNNLACAINSGSCYRFTTLKPIVALAKKSLGIGFCFPQSFTSASTYANVEKCKWISNILPTVQINLPTKIPTRPPTPTTSTTVSTACGTGYRCLNTGGAECRVVNGIYKSCRDTSGGTGDCCYPATSGGSGSKGSACTWSTSLNKCVGTITVSDCWVDTGGHECVGPITTCDTPSHNQGPLWCPTGKEVIGCLADHASFCVTGGGTTGGGTTGGGTTGGGTTGGGLNICEAGFECKKIGNCQTGCPAGGCLGCQKANEPGECCPLTLANPPQEPIEPPLQTEPPVPCSPSDDSGASCRNKNIGQSCSNTDSTLVCENPNGILSNIDQMPVCNCGTTTDNTASQPGQFCSPNSPSEICRNLKTGDVCELATQNKCEGSPDANAEILCSCSGSANPPSIPFPSVTSGPTPTSDPTQVNWFAQGTGDLCTSSIYRTYFADTKCRPYSRIGFQTENLPNPVACNADGSGECYKATGNKVSRKGINFTQSNNDICKSASTEADQKPLIYRDQISPQGPIKCSFDLPPLGNITAQIKLQFDDKSDENIFEAKSRVLDSRDRIHQIGIFLADRTNESLYVVNKYFTKKDFNQGNLNKSFTFKSLFNDHEYEVFIRVIKNKKIIPFAFTINCPGQNTGNSCLLKPKDNVNVAFTVKIEKRLPEEIKGDKIADIYNQIIEAYIGGKCDAKCISEKLKRLPESVGLQTATCDASLPGGCEFRPEDK